MVFLVCVLLPLAAIALETDTENASDRVKRSGGGSGSFLQSLQKSLFGASASLSAGSSGSSGSSHDAHDAHDVHHVSFSILLFYSISTQQNVSFLIKNFC